MSKYKGRELRIKVRTSTGPDVLRLLVVFVPSQ